MNTKEMLEYSNNPKLLKKMLPDIDMRCECLGSGKDETFTLEHDLWEIRLKYKREEIIFEFHNSNAELGNAPSLYSILACVGSDGLLEAGTFESFCSELGYDTDSRKHHKIYRLVCEQKAKIEKLFTREELEALPG